MKKNEDQRSTPNRTAFKSILKTGLAAAIGVQSRKNLERDSQQTSCWPYVAVGLILVTGFIASLVSVALVVVHFTR